MSLHNHLEKEALFLTALQNQQTQVYREKLSAFLSEGNSTNDSAALQEYSASCLGELSARIRVLEELLVGVNQSARAVNNSKQSTSLMSDTIVIDAKGLGQFDNLLELEVDAAGTELRWTGASRLTEIPVLVARKRPLELAIDAPAFIKPEFAQTLKLMVDGKQIEHKARQITTGVQVFGTVVADKIKNDATLITIELPQTYTAAELGLSNDHRKMGIALSRIMLTPKKSRVTKLLSR